MAKLVAFDEINFAGERLEVSDSISDLTTRGHGFGQAGNWNDEIQSFYVESGSWRLFENTQYGGLGTQTFTGGNRIANCQDAGFPNKWVSSIQKVGD
jgi:hypothetical protein